MKFILIMLFFQYGTSPSNPRSLTTLTAEFDSYAACNRAYEHISINNPPRHGSGCFAKK